MRYGLYSPTAVTRLGSSDACAFQLGPLRASVERIGMENHTLISRDLIPRQLAGQYFQNLVKVGPTEANTAVDWLEQATIKLSLSDCAKELRVFAEDKGVKLSQPESLLEAFFSLEGLRCSLEWSGPAVIQLLLEDAKKSDSIPSDFDEESFRRILERFFRNSKKLEQTVKAQRVYDGLVPNYEGCSSMVEFRPIYDESRETIVNGIITATLTVNVREVDVDGALKKYSFQVDAKDIGELLEELTRLRKKFKTLRAMTDNHVTLLNPSRSLELADE
jgi:hypothetical protein